MSGPALKQHDAHQSIHNAAFYEAEELTELVRHLLAAGERSKAQDTAQLVIEHWQTRTLRHAAEEEEGLYQEVLMSNSARIQDITALTRDHNLMRQLVAEAEALIVQSEGLELALARFDMLLWMVQAHSREEEKRLLRDIHL